MTHTAVKIRLMFQLTRPWEGATCVSFISYASPVRFQLTRPWEGATARQAKLLHDAKFQLTRPWEGATFPPSSNRPG